MWNTMKLAIASESGLLCLSERLQVNVLAFRDNEVHVPSFPGNPSARVVNDFAMVSRERSVLSPGRFA